jgi:hypothetical protein
MIKIPKRTRLYFEEQCLAQIPRYAFPHLYGKQVIGNCKYCLQSGNRQHDNGRVNDHLHVSAINSLIDDALDQAWDGQVNDNYQDQENQRNETPSPVRL